MADGLKDSDLYQRLKRKNCTLEETRLFFQLMNSGYSFRQCMDYLKDSHNEEIFTHALIKMEQGISVDKWAADFFFEGIKTQLDSFLRFLSLKEALQLSLSLYDHHHETQRQLIKMTGYPLIMFLFSLFGVQLFCAFCMPSLIQMMKGFDVSTQFIEVIYRLLMFISFLMSIIVIAFVFCVFLMTRPSTIVSGIEKLYRYRMGFIVQKELSAHFAMFYYHCVRLGIPTRKALHMLQQCHKQPLTVFLAHHVEKVLSDGGDLVEAVSIPYLDPSLQKLIKTAMLSSGAIPLLKGYLDVAHIKRQKRLKQIAQVVQILSYVFVAIMIMLVYQVLFLPLSMLERM